MAAALRKLLLDEMLKRVGHWLRAAGHDVVITEPDSDDAAILRRARNEGRLVVTCDKKLAERRLARGRVQVVAAAPPEETAAALGRALSIDWLYRPFTRCLVDNALLRPATAEERDGVPEQSRGEEGPVNVCPACGRLYWPGSHVRRMRERLERLQDASAAARPSEFGTEED